MDSDPPASTEARERACVVIIDDSVDFREALAEALVARSFLTVEAGSGEEGMAVVELVRPDVILVDERMPGLRGSEVIRELRGQGCKIPMVLMTAGESAVELARDAGTPFWVSKPADIATIEGVLTRALDVDDTPEPASQILQMCRLLETETGVVVSDPVRAMRALIDDKRRLERELDEDGQRSSLTSMTLASLVAHEIRSPLAALTLQIDQLPLIDDGLGEGQLAVLQRCRAIIMQADKLIEGAMTYAAIEAAELSVASAWIDLHTFVEGIVSVRREAARGVRISFESSGESAAFCDARLLRLVVTNLIDNAVKFSRGGTVTISVQSNERQHSVAVRDTGPGIDEEHRARVFRAFHRLEELAEGPIAGFGLGLAMVPRIVAALGGRLELESEVGVGSCFTVVMPASSPDVSSA